MADKKSERDERLAKALRENLRKRKAVASQGVPQEKEDRSS